jgi:hypothetical protein
MTLTVASNSFRDGDYLPSRWVSSRSKAFAVR